MQFVDLGFKAAKVIKLLSEQIFPFKNFLFYNNEQSAAINENPP